jgi:hAT family C-terminal dimerisation region
MEPPGIALGVQSVGSSWLLVLPLTGYRRRKSYIEQNWEKKWQKPVLERARKLWQEEYLQRDTQTAVTLPSRDSPPIDELDEFALIEKKMDVVKLARSVNDEFESFITATPFEISTTALEWWINPQQRQAYPFLSRMAIDLFSVPAMSAEAERVFSGARKIISWDRSRLGGTRIESLECLKHWMSHQAMDEIYIATTEDLATHIEAEVTEAAMTIGKKTVATLPSGDSYV